MVLSATIIQKEEGMARKARKVSSIGIYTVVLRGKTDCFEDASLKSAFLCSAYKYASQNQCSLLAYAISNKDCYMVVREKEDTLSNFIRRCARLFAQLYNKNHSGKVFQDRYLSEPLESDEQVIDSIKQIHNMDLLNIEYLTSKENYFDDMFIDSSFVLDRFTKKEWKKEMAKPPFQNEFKISVGKLSDKQVADYILQKYNIKVTQISKINKSLLAQIIKEVATVTKASARQLGRITSLPLRFLWGLIGSKDGRE